MKKGKDKSDWSGSKGEDETGSFAKGLKDERDVRGGEPVSWPGLLSP